MKKNYHFFPLNERKIVMSILFSLFLFASLKTFSQVRLVADLNLAYEENVNPSSFTFHTATSEVSYFILKKSELWRSDGTSEGTIMVKKFPEIRSLNIVAGTIYLSVYTEAQGFELWKSDGTEVGTVLVRDIIAGGGSSAPAELTNVNGTLFFAANDGIHGIELWKSDGTEAGTQLVKDIQPGGGSSNVSKFVEMNNKLFFVASNGTQGYELWSSDGTPGGTAIVKDIYPDYKQGSSPNYLTNSGGALFFSAFIPTIGRQLWKSDGTSEGTRMVKVIREGARPTNIKMITDVNGVIFFQASDDTHGLELWKSDGTEAGTYMVKDITPGPGSKSEYATPHLDYFANINGKLFFTAVTSAGQNLWVSDGTEPGTIQVTNISEISFSFLNPGFTNINGDALFTAMPGTQEAVSLFRSNGLPGGTTLVMKNVSESYRSIPMFRKVKNYFHFFGFDDLRKTDGTMAGSTIVKEFGYPAGSYPGYLTNANGTLYFYTSNYPGALWKTIGTSESTEKVYNFNSIEEMIGIASTVYFSASRNGQIGLWRSDGTVGGTIQLAPEVQYPRYFTESNGKIFFQGYSGQGMELWKTDGTTSGTAIVKDIVPGSLNGFPRNLKNVSHTLFFSATSLDVGEELWKTNGTSAGTVLVKDIWTGASSSGISNMIDFNGRLYFYANDGTNGLELWRSNGTAAGTVMVKDIRTGDSENPEDLGNMMASNSALFFTALANNGKTSLWKSTGVSYTTSNLKEFETNQLGTLLGTAGDIVFFIVHYNDHIELWKSNGTSAGTSKLKSFNNQYILVKRDAAVLNGVMYFSTYFNETQVATLWRTDGTLNGTFEIPFNGSAFNFKTSGPYVYFTGDSRDYGQELFLIDEGLTPLAEPTPARIINESDNDLSEESTEIVSSNPNPFRSNFSLRVNGNEDEKFTLNILSANGESISNEPGLSCNVEYTFGSTWNSGMYIIKVQHNQRLTTKKIIKIN